MPVSIFDWTFSGSSCYLLTSEHDEKTKKITQSINLYFFVVKKRRFKFIQAKS